MSLELNDKLQKMSEIFLNMQMLNLANLLSVLYLIGTSLGGGTEKGEENREIGCAREGMMKKFLSSRKILHYCAFFS